MGECKGDRRRSNTLDVADRLGGSHGNLARTRSLSSLREGGVPGGGGGGGGMVGGGATLGDTGPPVDPTNLLATVFWIAASLLESDYEFEYLLALRLLNRLLAQLPLEKPDSRERLERVQAKLRWYNFPGLLQLFLKGFTSAATQELTIHLLSKLISVSRHTLVDPSQVAGQSTSEHSSHSEFVSKIFLYFQIKPGYVWFKKFPSLLLFCSCYANVADQF